MQTSSPEFNIDLTPTKDSTNERFQLRENVQGSSSTPQFIVRAESPESRRQAVLEFEKELDAQTAAPTEQNIPSDVPALIGGAEILAQHHERSLALVLLRQAMAKDSFHIGSLRKIYGLLDGGEWTLAERTVIAETLSVTTKLASDTLRLAKLEYEKGDLGRSLEFYFEAAAQIREEDRTVFEIYKDIGNIYVRQGDFEGAEEYYHKAFALDPDSDALHVNLGTLEIQRQEWGQARDRFRFAISLNANNDKAWVGLALAHYHLGDVDLAFANLGKAIDISPLNRTAVLLLAGWSEKHNRVEEAATAIQEYLGQVSFDEDMSLALIQLFCVQKNYMFARFEIERALLWNPLRSDLIELLQKIDDLENPPVKRPSDDIGQEIFG